MANQVILFKDINLSGLHRHIFDQEANLNAPDDSALNDATSSIAVLSGNWRFFRHSDFQEPYPVVLGPGLYRRLESFGIRSDDLSSLRVTTEAPTVFGEPLRGHAVIFEHKHLRGDHRHILNAAPDLTVIGFDNKISSLVVLSANWSFFRDVNFASPTPQIAGPGVYYDVALVGAANDSLSSLRAGEMPATVSGPLPAEVILFEHENLRGTHKHIFRAEPNLAAPDDNFFNDRASSAAILSGEWELFADVGFVGPFPKLSPGVHPSFTSRGIGNDATSSLRPARPTEEPRQGNAIMAHTILFEHRNFRGAHKHVFNFELDLGAREDNFFDNRTSSVAVIDGSIRVFWDKNFQGAHRVVLGGLYPWVDDIGVVNDEISSLGATRMSPNPPGLPVDAHIILFEHKNFRGAHKHVLGPESNLDARDDNFFNDRASSLVVLRGNWELCRHKDFASSAVVLGPGRYPWVGDVGLANDSLS
jgi:hypothetical protein